MANIKKFRIVADVPFDWASTISEGDAAWFASCLLSPVVNVEFEYEDLGYVVNGRGGHTSMYRLWITGEEAIAFKGLERLAMALANCDELATLHIAEAKDTQWEDEDNDWEYVVDEGMLSGEAVQEKEPKDVRRYRISP